MAQDAPFELLAQGVRQCLIVNTDTGSRLAFAADAGK
jgi:hypothetical protein